MHHYLESWDDAEIIPGQLSLSQPCINPIFDTRSFQDSLLIWSGSKITYHAYILKKLGKGLFSSFKRSDFRVFWNESLGNGVYRYNTSQGKSFSFNKEVFKSMNSSGMSVAGNIEVILSESISFGNGMHANNPWLMELPDPVSKQCWENVAAISSGDAEKLGIKTGDLIKLSDKLKLPAFIQPGQANGTISIAIGYGRTNSGPVCSDIGVNVYPYIK